MRPNIEEAVAHYNDSFATALLVFIEDSTIAVFVFLFWLFILMKASRPWRLTTNGTQRDNSLMIMGVVVSLGLLCTIMTMGIYIDIKSAIFGAWKGSIIQALMN